MAVALLGAGVVCRAGLAEEAKGGGAGEEGGQVGVGVGERGEEVGGGTKEGACVRSVSSPAHHPRRLSRPQTPISLASLRVPSTTSLSGLSSSLSSSVGRSRAGRRGEGKGEQGPESPARQASYYAALMEEAAWEVEGREGEGIVSTMDGEMAPKDDKGLVHQRSLSAPSLVAVVTDEEGVGET